MDGGPATPEPYRRHPVLRLPDSRCSAVHPGTLSAPLRPLGRHDTSQHAPPGEGPLQRSDREREARLLPQLVRIAVVAPDVEVDVPQAEQEGMPVVDAERAGGRPQRDEQTHERM